MNPPDAELSALFRREQALKDEMAAVQEKLRTARLRYMIRHRTFGVRMESLRRDLG